MLRANVYSNVVKVIDIAKITESSRNSGLWTPGLTIDGVHGDYFYDLPESIGNPFYPKPSLMLGKFAGGTLYTNYTIYVSGLTTNSLGAVTSIVYSTNTFVIPISP